jgi:hypothetical protein
MDAFFLQKEPPGETAAQKPASDESPRSWRCILPSPSTWALDISTEEERKAHSDPFSPMCSPLNTARRCNDASQASAATFDSSDPSFLHSFNSQFPLDQNTSWQLFRLSTKLSSSVSSELQGQPQSMDSWRRLTRKGNAIGVPGSSGTNTITWTPSSALTTPPQLSQPCKPSLHLSNKEASAEGGRLALKLSKSHHVPSSRTSNWTLGPTRAAATAHPPSAGRHLSTNQRAAAVRTPSRRPSSQFQSASRAGASLKASKLPPQKPESWAI